MPQLIEGLYEMIKLPGQIILVAPLAVLCIGTIAGCSSSEETAKPGMVTIALSEVDSLHNVISNCKSQIVTLEHENQTVHSLEIGRAHV